MKPIAALFVAPGGAYFDLPGVDPWDQARDARRYPGPHAVVAHPPCERWGRYWSGGPSAKVRREKGDDQGCFESALASVRKWGGVLEHPEASSAWDTFGLMRPPKTGGWLRNPIGWTCCVEQGHYGHRARKATWLYVVVKREREREREPAGVGMGPVESPLGAHHGAHWGSCHDVPTGTGAHAYGLQGPADRDRQGCCMIPPALIWGPSNGERLDEGFHSTEERRAARAGGAAPRARLTTAENIASPVAFRDLLIHIARGCQ